MAFIDSEASRRASRPVEVYDILAGTTHIRVVNQPVGVTSPHDSNFYAACAALSRRRISREAVGGPTSQQEIVMPRSVLAAVYNGPPQPFEVTVTRVQPGGHQRMFRGSINNNVVTVEKGKTPEIKLLCVGLTEARLQRRFPGLVMARSCQRSLYDKWCRFPRGTFEHETTVADSDDLEIVVASHDGRPDGWFTSGEIWQGTERRMITTHFGDILTIDFPFAATVTGAVTIYPGCDKSVSTCQTKFNNVVHFQGAPQCRDSNPHLISLDNIDVYVE